MKSLFILFVWIILKKADGITSGFTNVQEPTEFKIGSNPHKNRTPLPFWIWLVIDTPNPSVIREPRSINSSKNSQNQPEFESEPAKQPNPKSADLKTIGYFWSDAMNCFLFGHGPMTPTLLDVTMITGLDIASPNPATHKMTEVPFKLSSKVNCTNWGTYMSQHIKTKGPVIE